MWSDKIDQIDFDVQFGLDAPGNRSIPSRADNRNQLSRNQVKGLYDTNPYKTGYLIVHQGSTLSFLSSGLTNFRTASASFSGAEITKVIPTDMGAFTVVVQGGQAFTTYYDTSAAAPLMSTPATISAFSSIVIADMIAFSRPLSGGGWIRFDETVAAEFAKPVGYMVLSNTGQLYWTKRAPIDAWEAGADVNAANEITPATLFGNAVSPFPTIVKIYGKYDSFFLIDSTGATWAFGATSNQQLCDADPSAPLSQAIKITPGKRWKWIFPLVEYVSDNPVNYNSPNILQTLSGSETRSTIFVSDTEILLCGSDSAVWSMITSGVLIPNVSATNPIVDVSFSLLSGIARLADDSLYTIGYPRLTDQWTRYDQLGALKSRPASTFVALSPGGGAVASRTFPSRMVWHHISMF
jgi:hypothetical protein